MTLSAPTQVCIELHDDAGNTTILKDGLKLLAGEVIDASTMSKKALCDFLAAQIADAKANNILLSLHLKATMMKVSDPIIFGHAVKVFYKEVFDKYADKFASLGVDPNNGIGDVYSKIQSLTEEERGAIEADLLACYATGPELAMVDSDRGITNLHVPSDIIIDFETQTGHLLDDAICVILEIVEDMEPDIPDRIGKIRARIQADLRRYFNFTIKRRPVILPFILEI